MAFSSTLLKTSVVGDMVVKIYEWTAGTDASGVIATGIGHVYVAIPTNSENYSEAPKVEKNVGGSGALEGSVKLTFADATNNTGELVVYGRDL